MGKKLIKVFKARINESFEGNDVERYIKTIDEIIRKVYNNRYGYLWKKPENNKPAMQEYSKKKFEKADFSFSDGRLRIDPYVFQEKCWKELEDKNFIRKKIAEKIAENKLINDKKLESYIYTIFKNILQNMIGGLSPWFDSRKKQVSTILNENCDKIEINKIIYYKLKSMPEDKIPEPADIEKIQEAATSLNPPPLQFPKNPYSERGPSVDKKEMEEYLLEIIKNAGGIIIYNDLLKFIKKIYGYTEIKQVSPTISYNKNMEEDEQGGDDMISNLCFRENQFRPTADHLLMADDIADILSPKIKQLIYLWKIKELKGENIAENMNISTGTVSGLKNEFSKIVFNYFNQEQDLNSAGPVITISSFDVEGMEAVKQIIYYKLFDEMKNNE